MPDTDAADMPVGVLRLPDIAYETTEVRVPLNDSECVFEMWVNGPGCPGRVKAEYARKLRAFQLSEDAPQAAHIEFMVAALRVVSKNMTLEQADLLGGDVDRATAIMIHTKWFRAPDAEDAPDPEVMGEDSTTDGSSPTLQRVSAAPAPTAAAG